MQRKLLLMNNNLSEETKNANILGSIGLCRRAGKLLTGFDAIVREMADPAKKKKIAGVLVASDVSPKTKKEVLFHCGKHGVNSAETSATMAEIEGVLKKRTGILAITDEGFYKMLTK